MVITSKPANENDGRDHGFSTPSVSANATAFRFLDKLQLAWAEDRATVGTDPSADSGAKTEAGCPMDAPLV